MNHDRNDVAGRSDGDRAAGGLSRRALLIGGAAAATVAIGRTGGRSAHAQAAGDVGELLLETVLGPVKGRDVEKALAHEHLFVDFLGPGDPHYMEVNWSDVIGASVNAAQELRAQGVNLMIEWTNLGVGRNVLLLRHVARATGLHIVCPTGIYKSLVPPQFAGQSVDAIAAHFVRELTKGIDGTAIRAGFIKIATTESGAIPTDTVIHRAAAIAGREAQATIALHSPIAATTKAVVAVLEQEGFPMGRFVWGHAQPSSTEEHRATAGRGATIQYDAIGARSDPFFQGPTDDDSMLDRIEALVKAGFDRQVIVSADASVYVNPPKFQYDRDNTYVYRYFEAKLADRLGAGIARQVLRDNVIRAFRRGDKVS
jgi:predicted metal-dependent phosphotriesterase family hydrolase